jgi:hypothetical protein
VAFDKGRSASVTSFHLIRFGELPDETHISTQRAPTQQEAWVPRQNADPGRSRNHQAPPPKGPEANRRLRRCTSRFGPLPSFKMCFDLDPDAAAVGSWSFRLQDQADPRGSASSWGER